MENKRNSIVFLLGLPIVLLLISGFFLSTETKSEYALQVNKYIPKLPENYANSLEKIEIDSIQKTDSIQRKKAHTAFVVPGAIQRELVIIKEEPTRFQVAQDFSLKIYPSEKNKLPLHKNAFDFLLQRDAVIYTYNNKEYAVFKFELPLIDIEKIDIEQLFKNKKLKTWKATLKHPFNKLKTIELEHKKINNATLKVPNVYQPLLALVLKMHKIPSLEYSYLKQKDSLFQALQAKDQYIGASNKTLLSIKNQNDFWKGVHQKDKTINSLINYQGEDSDKAKSLLENYTTGKISFGELFSTKELAKYYAIIDLLTDRCTSTPLHFIYEENQLKPLFTQFNCVGNSSKFIKKTPILNQDFVLAYIDELDRISNLNIDQLLETHTHTLDEIKYINQHYPNKIFSKDDIEINKLKIKKNLSQSTKIKSELISVNEAKIVMSVLNTSFYPIQIKGLNHKGKKQIIALNPSVQIASGKRDTITIDLPRSFENLFVSKKSKSTGFLLHKHIYDLFLEYNTIGLDEVNLASIIPYQEKEEVAEDLFRTPKFINSHEDLVINDDTKTITFNKKNITVSTPLVISAKYTFSIEPGTQVNIINGGKIISHAALKFKGTKSEPIVFNSSDKKGQGILILSASKKSELKYVEFNNLTNPRHGSWSVTGAVTFYESEVDLNYVTVKNNSCEDALNVVRTRFIMKNSTIENTQSDAFDGDFVTGTISNSTFNRLGNDAIDVSGSDLTIQNVIVSNAGDKGLSAGEDSKMSITDVEIINSEIGVAGKDLSIVEIKKLKIENTKLAFTAFQKKPEFGPSSIKVINVEMKNVETDYLIEDSSSMLVDGKKIETSENVKDRMYGVEFGVSSAETRNSQN